MSTTVTLRACRNALARWLAAALLTASGTACHDSTSPKTSPTSVPTSISIVSGTPQTGTVGAALASPLVVQVNDQRGHAMSGVTVTWAVTSGGGSLTSTTTTTGANGRAQTSWTLGHTAGPATATATVRGLTPATFTVTQLAAAAASVTGVSGNNQTGTVGTALAQPLVVLVADQYGNPVAGATVTFTNSGGGAAAAMSAATDATGQARTTLTLGTTAGLDLVSATVAGVPQAATFSETATAAAPSMLIKVSGDNQSAPRGTTLPAPFVVRVTDRYGNPVAGGAVTWTKTLGALSSTSSTTDATGEAQTTLSLSLDPGPQAATATVSGLASVTFTAMARD